jgi:hypothetical protein
LSLASSGHTDGMNDLIVFLVGLILGYVLCRLGIR